jgi:ABC-type Mn2+/Zn2+ transport system permease subunit
MTLLTAIALSLACAVLSVLVVLKRWSFIGEGISHSGFGGAGTAWVAALLFPALDRDWVPYAFVVAFCFATAITIGAITRRRRVHPDAAIGIFLVASLAWGFLAERLYAQYHNGVVPAGFQTFLFGQMDYISPSFALGVIIVSVAVIATVWLLGKELMYYAFDPAMAENSGVQTGIVHYLLLALLAVVLIVGVRIAGSVLVPALLILPGTIALLLSRQLKSVFLLAAVAGLIGALGGFAAHARWPFVPTGPAIVLTLFVLFLASLTNKLFRRQ